MKVFVPVALIIASCARSPSEACAAKVRRLTAELVRINGEATSLDKVYADVELPTAFALSEGLAPPGSLILVRDDHVFLDGRDLGETNDSASTLEMQFGLLTDRWRALHPNGPAQRAYFFAEGRAPVRNILGLVQLLAKHGPVRLVVSPTNAQPPPVTPAGASAFKRRSAAAQRQDLARIFGEELTQRSSTCPGFNKRLVALSHSPIEGRGERLIEATSLGLSECNCSIPDFEALSYVLAIGLSADAKRRRSIPLPLEAGAKTILRLPHDATLQDVVTRLAAPSNASPMETIEIKLIEDDSR
jgi:hypothetical protein